MIRERYNSTRPRRRRLFSRRDGLLDGVGGRGGSSLSYDPAVDQYVYVWKSDKAWAGTCRRLDVTLKDGTQHIANFRFTK